MLAVGHGRIAYSGHCGHQPFGAVAIQLFEGFNFNDSEEARTNYEPVTANSSPAVPTPSNTKDLGELDLTNRYETCVNLGAGRSCTITPKLLDRDSLQLTMSLQSRRANGKTAGLIVTQVTTRPGKPFEVAIGDMDITITPEIVQE